MPGQAATWVCRLLRTLCTDDQQSPQGAIASHCPARHGIPAHNAPRAVTLRLEPPALRRFDEPRHVHGAFVNDVPCERRLPGSASLHVQVLVCPRRVVRVDGQPLVHRTNASGAGGRYLSELCNLTVLQWRRQRSIRIRAPRVNGRPRRSAARPLPGRRLRSNLPRGAEPGIEALAPAVLPRRSGLWRSWRQSRRSRRDLPGDEFRAIVGPYEHGRAPQDEPVPQGVDHVGRIELAVDTDHPVDRQAMPASPRGGAPS